MSLTNRDETGSLLPHRSVTFEKGADELWKFPSGFSFCGPSLVAVRLDQQSLRLEPEPTQPNVSVWAVCGLHYCVCVVCVCENRLKKGGGTETQRCSLLPAHTLKGE